MRRFVLLLLAACALLAAACGRSLVPVSSLAPALPLAEVRREVAVLDLATPAARAHLGSGWSLETSEADRPVVRTTGGPAELTFFLTAARNLSLSFTAASPVAAEVRFAVNGRPLDAVRLAPGSWIYDLALPGRLLAPGDNRLTVRTAPGAVVSWEELRFPGLPAGGEPRATAEGLLALPFGARLDFFVRWPEQPSLLLDRLSARGGAGRLLVTVQPAGGGAVEAARIEPGEGPESLALPALRPGEPVRLSLAAVPADGPPLPAVPGAGLVLARPALASAARIRNAPEAAGRTDPATSPNPSAGRRRNLVVYLVDTLRADRLGCYGGRRPLTPAIDAFAREATLFRHAVAQSSWTRPSVASLWTGLTPRAHGVHGRRESLSDEAVTLAEILRGRGFRTAGVVANAVVAEGFGVGQGFEHYELLATGADSSEAVNRRAAALLDGLVDAAGAGRPGAPPFFLYLHTIDPHGPYLPPADLRQRFAPGIPPWVGSRRFLRELNHRTLKPGPATPGDMLRLYEAEVAANDRSFGALLAELRRRGLWEDTVVVLVSDHGEEFFEHGGWEHGRSLHAEVLDVPLIVRFPGLGEGRQVAALAQHVDLLPTLLAALGLPAPAGVEGRNLLAHLPASGDAGDAGEGSGRAGETAWDPAVYSDLDLDGRTGTAVTTPVWRFIDRRGPTAAALLYARRQDPRERRDLARARPVEAGFLRSLLRARALLPGRTLTPGTGRIDEAMREQLRALGYLR
jgi:choline-sulfatase